MALRVRVCLYPRAGTIVNVQDSDDDNAGGLINSNGMQIRVTADGTVATTNSTAIDEGFETFIPQLNNGVLLLNIDGALIAFNPVDNSLEDLSLELEVYFRSFARDGQEVFISKQNTLYRTTGGGNAVIKIGVEPYPI